MTVVVLIASVVALVATQKACDRRWHRKPSPTRG